MLGFLLAIDHREAERTQYRDEMNERHLRCVGLERKHRFSEEHPSDPHAVETADQFAIAPSLHRMGVTALVQLRIRIDDFAE